MCAMCTTMSVPFLIQQIVHSLDPQRSHGGSGLGPGFTLNLLCLGDNIKRRRTLERLANDILHDFAANVIMYKYF